MIRYAYLEAPGLHFLKVSGTFTLKAFHERVKAATASAEKDGRVGRPAIVDLREALWEGIGREEVRRHVMRKSGIGQEHTDVPTVYLVTGMAAYAKVRTVLVYSELADVVAEANTLITEDEAEATDWLAGRAGLDRELVRACVSDPEATARSPLALG